MSRRVLYLLTLLLLLFPFGLTRQAQAQSIFCTNNLYEVPGQSFWTGEIALDNENGPVLVLVHGYSSNANQAWTFPTRTPGEACRQGFRVAAVDLPSPAGSIWTNGADLVQIIAAIKSHYGVQSVSVAGHSKGGNDLEIALVHEGQAATVDNFIALGAPFGGTELADLGCSFLGQWLGICDEGIEDMTTASMAAVRAITDGRPEWGQVNAYMTRGWECPLVLFLACIVIPGEDDGTAPVWSAAANADATLIFDRTDLHHFEIHELERYDDTIWESLRSPPPGALSAAAPSAPPVARTLTSSHLLRGGPLAGRVVERFPVEDGLSALYVGLLTSAEAQVTLIAPDGSRRPLTGLQTPDSALLGGQMYPVRIERPATGTWTLVARPLGKAGGYLLAAAGEDALSIRLDGVESLRPTATRLPLRLALSAPVREVQMTVTLLRAGTLEVLGQSTGSALDRPLALPADQGMVDLHVQVRGLTERGNPFERTLVTRIAVGDAATLLAASRGR